MAIDRTGISSLDAGAGEITYSGNEGPKSPDQQLMAQADPMLVEMYQQYGFEMEEQGLQPMSFREFMQEAMSGMATGGRAGYASGQLVKPGPGRPGYQGGPQDWGQQERAEQEIAAGAKTVSGDDTGAYKGKSAADMRSLSQASPSHGGMETAWSQKEEYKDAGFKTLADSAAEKAKAEAEEKSIKEKYNDWYRKNQISYIQKTKKKALINRLNKYLNLTGDDLLTLDDDDETIFNVMQNLESEKFIDQKSGAHYPGSTGLASLDMISGALGAPHFSKEQAMDYWSDYKNVADWEGTDPNMPDWLERMKEFSPNQYNTYVGKGGGDDGGQPIYPYPYQTASVPETDTPTDVDPVTGFPVDPIRFTGGISPVHDFTGIYGQRTIPVKDGGRIGYAGGGIADLRQGYFLGKLVKKITRGAKKVLKSPVGRMALLYGLGTIAGGSTAFGGAGGSWFSRLKDPALLKNLITPSGWSKGNILNPLLRSKGKGWTKDNPVWGGLDKWKLGIGAASLYPLIKGMGGDDDKDFTETDLYKRWLAEKQGWDKKFAPVGDQANWQPIRFANGGRTGYAGGGYNDDEEEENSHRSAALKAMYRRGAQEGGIMDQENMLMAGGGLRGEKAQEIAEMMAEEQYGMEFYDLPLKKQMEVYQLALDLYDSGGMATGGRVAAQEGGLMDMGGMEKDYRNEGGFVPIGGQERADDVPARLSKNEFVFTADAVRNAGGGDIDKGAEIMENLMENLEQGGKVSEDSQGLEGARDMFATSQRLEGVL